MGVPTLRLRADYLAIVTISIAEVVRLFVRSQTFRDVFGGADGISDFSAAYRDLSPFDPSLGYGLGPFQNDGVMRWLLLVLWLGLAVAVAVAATRAERVRSRDQGVRLAIGGAVLVVTVLVMLWVLDRLRYSGYTMWTLTLGWLARRPARRVHRGRSCAARAAACSRRSARTRTPCAASARASTPTRCRRSSWAASSACSPACVRALDRGVGAARQLRPRRHVLHPDRARPRRPGHGHRVDRRADAVLGACWRSPTTSSTSSPGSDGVWKVGGITIIESVTQVGQIRFALVGLAADAADDLPPAGLARQPQGDGARWTLTTPRSSSRPRSPIAAVDEPPHREYADAARAALARRRARTPGAAEARPDPRRRRRRGDATAASSPSTSTTSRCSAARSPR